METKKALKVIPSRVYKTLNTLLADVRLLPVTIHSLKTK